MNLFSLGTTYKWNHIILVIFIWLISLSIMFLRFIYVVVCARISFLFKSESYFIAGIYHILFIHSLDDRYLGCSHLSASLSNTVISICMQVSVWVSAFNFSGSISRSRIADLYGNSIFSFLKNFPTVFHSNTENFRCSVSLSKPWYFSFFKFLLGWHWLTKLYRFQVHNSTIHHLYTVSSVHHLISRLLPSPFMPPLSSFTSLNPHFSSCNHHTVVCVFSFF